jgi:hypothetical protein
MLRQWMKRWGGLLRCMWVDSVHMHLDVLSCPPPLPPTFCSFPACTWPTPGQPQRVAG